MNNFWKVFKKDKPIIGMLHLARDNKGGISKRLRDELKIYSEEGIGGVLVENYHGDMTDTVMACQMTKVWRNEYYPDLAIGVNVLPNEFEIAFKLVNEFKMDFIQLDHVSGIYNGGRTELDFKPYMKMVDEFPDIVVLGGVWPKYYNVDNATDEQLEKDLSQAMIRADAVVVTGEGTGKQTPLDKIKSFKFFIGNHPLVVGAGMDLDNAKEQLLIADGAIVGSYFKGGDTTQIIDGKKVRALMDVVNSIRGDK